MIIIMFIVGTILGSFYNVVGYRIPKGESIVYPPSHCPKCNHKLKFYELIPIISYVIQKGKCRKCHNKVSLFYPIFEFITGLLFALAYVSFGFEKELLIVLTYVSFLVIISVSDYEYMIIPDEVIIFFSIILLLEIGIIFGVKKCMISLIGGIISFVFMFMLKIIGDFIFKRESMGGGDIKMMFVTGIVLTYPVAIMSIFVGSFVAFPISVISLKKNPEHILPFGPILALGALILLLLRIDVDTIIRLYKL